MPVLFKEKYKQNWSRYKAEGRYAYDEETKAKRRKYYQEHREEILLKAKQRKERKRKETEQTKGEN